VRRYERTRSVPARHFIIETTGLLKPPPVG
jgi:hypothetical protein